jgi:hypothetical protein
MSVMIFRFSPDAVFAVALAAFAAPGAGLAAPSEASPLTASAAATEDAFQGGSPFRRPEAVSREAKILVAKKSDSKNDAKGKDSKKAGKPQQVGNYGDWGVFTAQTGKDKTCYALASPKERAPGGLKRDPAYIFISNRPAENVRNEVSIIMGFTLKDSGDAQAEISGSSFDLVGKGANAWIKNLAEEAKFVEAVKKGVKLTITASSLKGNVTTDTYSLIGISQALEKVEKDCP